MTKRAPRVVYPKKKRTRTSRRALFPALTVITTVLGFTWLSVYSYSTYGPGGSRAPHRYHSMDDLIHDSLRDARLHDRRLHGSAMTPCERFINTINVFDAEHPVKENATCRYMSQSKR